jgi:hypothetical protein
MRCSVMPVPPRCDGAAGRSERHGRPVVAFNPGCCTQLGTATPRDFHDRSWPSTALIADLMHTLWEADVEVFKAHITTSPAGEVLDMFWLYDNRQQLPDHHRQAPAHHGAMHHNKTLPLAAWCQGNSSVTALSGGCQGAVMWAVTELVCRTTASGQGPAALSGGCHGAVMWAVTGLVCRTTASGQGPAALSGGCHRCCHVGCHRISVQDYCIRPGTSSAVRRLSGYFSERRFKSGHIVWHAMPCQYLENSPMCLQGAGDIGPGADGAGAERSRVLHYASASPQRGR